MTKREMELKIMRLELVILEHERDMIKTQMIINDIKEQIEKLITETI